MYADKDAYVKYGSNAIPEDELNRALRKASRHIDTLTYNRIVGRGFSNLSAFQRDLIVEVCCELADFEYENADMIDSVLQSYGINGVNMTFGESWNMKCINGVAIRRDIYDMLCQTGLCCKRLGG